jgi:hypothetical protein
MNEHSDVASAILDRSYFQDEDARLRFIYKRPGSKYYWAKIELNDKRKPTFRLVGESALLGLAFPCILAT